ncbi:MAG: 23S rRNA (adenine(2503)-C(2))-methyltransferase RlmN [Eubacteriales bacterium]|nr:23S rRNA (adenine(2503)-C(2))-methyltransferase RlmN [Eubacteriales bacterium]
MLPDFLDLETADLEALVAELDLPEFRAKQLKEGQFRAISSFDELTNLPKKLRAYLNEHYFPGLPEIQNKLISDDGLSQKLVLAYPDGEVIEAVIMEQSYGHSLCLSSQVGCTMGCRFCASTGLAKARNLSRGELLGQFLLAEQLIAPAKITNLDLMGIGEPLDNYDEVLAFIRRLVDPDHRNFSARKICLSTCGLVPQIKRLAKEGLPLTLTISLHAPWQELRSEIMPISRAYPLNELMEAANYYFEQTGRRVSFEYALFAGVNDSPEAARALAQLLHGLNCHVNLIPANPVPGTDFQSVGREGAEKFLAILTHKGINATLRRSFGKDIQAACGQLRRSSLLEDQGYWC